MALSPETVARRVALTTYLLERVGVRAPSVESTDPGTYVCRALMNVWQLKQWWAGVRKPGEPDLDDNLHVTVAYSATTFPWTPDPMSVTVAASALSFGVLGDDNAVVVFMDSPDLQSRWHATVVAGAVWNFPEYHPHLTLFFLGAEHDAKCAMPWTSGAYPPVPAFPLVFGPELVGTLDEDVFTGKPRADDVRENPNHAPAGTPEGGQFTAGSSGSATAWGITDSEIGEHYHNDWKETFANPTATTTDAYCTTCDQPPTETALKIFATTMKGYHSINDPLRAGTAPGDVQFVDRLDSAIASTQPTSEALTVYRGIGGTMADKFPDMVGQTIHDDGFTSATRSVRVASHYSEVHADAEDLNSPNYHNNGVLAVIKIPAGSKVLQFNSMPDSPLAPSRNHEVLLPRGGDYVVRSITPLANVPRVHWKAEIEYRPGSGARSRAMQTADEMAVDTNRFHDWTLNNVTVSTTDGRLRFNANHDAKGEFASGDSAGAAAWKSGKVLRALNSYKPSTAAKQRKGEAEQARLATLVGLTNTDDNAPFDLLGGKNGVEVKTLIDNDNDKITVHPASRLRKEAFAQAHGLAMHTVAIDTRGNARAYYYKAGVGAYRLGSMERVSVADLRSRLKS